MKERFAITATATAVNDVRSGTRVWGNRILKWLDAVMLTQQCFAGNLKLISLYVKKKKHLLGRARVPARYRTTGQ